MLPHESKMISIRLDEFFEWNPIEWLNSWLAYQVHHRKVRCQVGLELMHRGVRLVRHLVRMTGPEEEVDEVRRRSRQMAGWGGVGADEVARANANRNAGEGHQVLRRKRNRPRISDRNKGWIRRRHPNRRPYPDWLESLAVFAKLQNTVSIPWKSTVSSGVPSTVCFETKPKDKSERKFDPWLESRNQLYHQDTSI